MKNLMLIPIHPPKMGDLIGMLNTLQRQMTPGAALDFDIMLLATDVWQLSVVRSALAIAKIDMEIEVVSVLEYLADTLRFERAAEYFRTNTNRCAVNLKKLAGLHLAFARGYEWVMCLDGDCVFLRDPVGLFDQGIRNYGQKLAFGVVEQHQEIVRIIAQCRDFLGPDAAVAGVPLSSWYAWFFEIPTYQAADFAAFLDAMSARSGGFEAFLMRIEWESFEHVMYQFYLMAERGMKAIDYGEIGIANIPEALSFEELARIKSRYDYLPLWIRVSSVFRQPHLMAGRGRPFYLGFHFDRI